MDQRGDCRRFRAATLMTHNPIFVMLKPSLIYVLVGGAMLQRAGWSAICRHAPWNLCPIW